MSDENWMTRLLGDARDLALQSSRAKIQMQERQLEHAQQRIADLTAQRDGMTTQLDELRAQAAASDDELTRLVHELTELAVKVELLETEYGAVHTELSAARAAVTQLQTEYGKAAIRERMLEARLTGLLRRLLGDSGVLALRDLLVAEAVDEVGLPTRSERSLLDALERD